MGTVIISQMKYLERFILNLKLKSFLLKLTTSFLFKKPKIINKIITSNFLDPGIF